MPNYPDVTALSELLRKQAYYNAGGNDPGMSDLEKGNRILGTIDTGIHDYQSIRKAQEDSITRALQQKQLELENKGKTRGLKSIEELAGQSPAQGAVAGTESPSSVAGVQGSTITQSPMQSNVPPILKPYEKYTPDEAHKLSSIVKSLTPAETKPSSLMTPEDASLQADIAIKNGGQLPNMGMGGMPARLQVIHAMTQKMASSGQGADALALNKAGMKAGTEALGQLEKNQAVMGGFLNTLDNQLNLLHEYSQQVDSSGIPALQRWINAGKKEILGDVAVNNLNNVINTVNTEYNRAMNTVTGGGAVADAGVQRNQENLRSANTPQQIEGWINTVKSESANRKQGFLDQDTALRSQLYNLGKSQPSSTSISTPTASKVPPQSESEQPPAMAKAAIRLANGNPVTFKNGQTWAYKNGMFIKQ